MFDIKKVSALAVIVVLVSTYMRWSTYEKNSEPKIILSDRYGVGDDDHPNARQEYERMMLMDPATGEIPARIRERELAFAALLPYVEDDAASRSNISWTNRGPWNVGGRTRGFAMDVTNENILFAGSPSGSIWRSVDAGATWTEVTPKDYYHGITCIAQDTRPGHTNTWYCGTGEGYGASASGGSAYYYGNGMYKSTDGGLTWNPIASTTSNTLHLFDNFGDIVWNIALNKAEPDTDIVYAAGCLSGILRSTNGGTTWSAVRGSMSLSNNNSYFTNVELTSTGIVYATLSSDGLQKGIWRSANGISFVNILPSNFPTTYERIVSAIAPSNENVVYFICNTPGFGTPDTNFQGDIEWNSLWKYTYLTGDGSGSGGIWQDLSSSLPTTGGTFDKFQCQGSYDLIIKVKPDDPNTVFLGGTNLYRSTNGFADTLQTTFMGGYEKGCERPYVRSYLDHHPDQHEIFFLPSNPNVLFSGNDGGVFRTDNCLDSIVTWTPLNNGYITSMFYTVAIDHATTNSNIIIGGTQDNGTWYTRSANPTSPWTHPGGGDGSFCYVANNESAFYTSTQNGKVYRALIDTTGTVTSFSRIDPIGGHGYLFINPYTVDPNNNNRMYLAGGNALWRNNDLSGISMSNTFDSISTNWFMFPDTLTTLDIKITSLAVSNIPANRVYVGTNKGRVYRINNAHTDTAVFTNITSTTPNAIFPATGYVSCVAVDPSHADRVIVVFSNYSVYSLFYTTNGGTSWKKIAGNLEQFASGTGNGPSCRWVSILPVSNGNVYLLGTSVGLYATNILDSINTVWWQQGVNTIGKVVVTMLDTRFSDGMVAAATHANGVYAASVFDFNDVVGIDPKENAGLNISAGVYPNPASDVAFIRYRLNSPAASEINILDNEGKLVKRISDGTKNAGRHEISLNASSLKAGLYFVVLKTSSGESAFTKFVVAR